MGEVKGGLSISDCCRCEPLAEPVPAESKSHARADTAVTNNSAMGSALSVTLNAVTVVGNP